MRREDGTRPYDLHPEDYARYKGRWWVCDPAGVYYALDARWSVDEHDDGTITVSPSLNHEPVHGAHGVSVPWHGWLRAGVWSPV